MPTGHAGLRTGSPISGWLYLLHAPGLRMCDRPATHPPRPYRRAAMPFVPVMALIPSMISFDS